MIADLTVSRIARRNARYATDRLDRIEERLEKVQQYERAQVLLETEQVKLVEQHTEFFNRVLDALGGPSARRAARRADRNYQPTEPRHLHAVREE